MAIPNFQIVIEKKTYNFETPNSIKICQLIKNYRQHAFFKPIVSSFANLLAKDMNTCCNKTKHS